MNPHLSQLSILRNTDHKETRQELLKTYHANFNNDDFNSIDCIINTLVRNNIKIAKIIELAGFYDRRSTTMWQHTFRDIKELIEHKKVKKILLLYRENLFKQALSYCISQKLQFFHGDHNFIRNSIIGKLNEEEFRIILRQFDCYNKFIKSLPNSNKYKLCKYENFFEIKGRLEIHWKDLFKFLGYKYDGTMVDHLKNLKKNLNPISDSGDFLSIDRKYNGPETYAKIKNLENLKSIYSDFISLFAHDPRSKAFL